MKFPFIPITLLLIVSCKAKPKEWQTLDFGAFRLKTPQGWEKIKQQGIDSYFGGLAKGKDTLWFDYGRYNVNFSDEDTGVYRYAKDTVNGLHAMIMIPDIAGKGSISMSIPKVSGKNKFTIWGANLKDTDTILKIYKSIIFHNSDTAQNPPLALSKFASKAHGDGRMLFNTNCASCHSIIKNIIGPPLDEVASKRSNDWIYTFLTDRKKIQTDSSYHPPKENDVHCMEFPSLSKGDVELLTYYIQAQ